MSNKSCCLSHHWAKASLLLWRLPFYYFLGLLNVDIFLTWDKPLCSFTCYFASLCMILFIGTIQVVSNKSVSFLGQRTEVLFAFYKQCLLIFGSLILLRIWWKPSRYYLHVPITFYVALYGLPEAHLWSPTGPVNPILVENGRTWNMQETKKYKMFCCRRDSLSLDPGHFPGPNTYLFSGSTVFENVVLESPKYTACSVVQVLPSTSCEILDIILS